MTRRGTRDSYRIGRVGIIGIFETDRRGVFHRLILLTGGFTDGLGLRSVVYHALLIAAGAAERGRRGGIIVRPRPDGFAVGVRMGGTLGKCCRVYRVANRVLDRRSPTVIPRIRYVARAGFRRCIAVVSGKSVIRHADVGLDDVSVTVNPVDRRCIVKERQVVSAEIIVCVIKRHFSSGDSKAFVYVHPRTGECGKASAGQVIEAVALECDLFQTGVAERALHKVDNASWNLDFFQ